MFVLGLHGAGILVLFGELVLQGVALLELLRSLLLGVLLDGQCDDVRFLFGSLIVHFVRVVVIVAGLLLGYPSFTGIQFFFVVLVLLVIGYFDFLKLLGTEHDKGEHGLLDIEFLQEFNVRVYHAFLIAFFLLVI